MTTCMVYLFEIRKTTSFILAHNKQGVLFIKVEVVSLVFVFSLKNLK